MKTVIGIAINDVWQEAFISGEYTQSTIDSTLSEVGFIHCSTPDQTVAVAERKYPGRDDLVLLFIDVSKLKAPIKFEKALSGRPGIFPHIYGPLNVDAVFETHPLPMDKDGHYFWPIVA